MPTSDEIRAKVTETYQEPLSATAESYLGELLRLAARTNIRHVFVGSGIGGAGSQVDLDVVIVSDINLLELNYFEQNDRADLFEGSLTTIEQVSMSRATSGQPGSATRITLSCRVGGALTWVWSGIGSTAAKDISELGLVLMDRASRPR